MSFGGKLAGTQNDYLYPIPKLSRKMVLDKNGIDIINQKDFNQCNIPVSDLLGVLESHILKYHISDVNLMAYLSLLKSKLVFDHKSNLDKLGNCQKIPKTTIPSIFSIQTPLGICNIIDRILSEIVKTNMNNICFKLPVKHSNLGALISSFGLSRSKSIEQGALLVYQAILRGECEAFLNIQARCVEHSQPCRQCCSASILVTEKPGLGILAKEISNNLKAHEISKDRLYQLQYDVVFRDKDVLLKMYPPCKALSRFKTACGQVASMIRSKVKKGNLNDILRISKIWEQEVLEGKVKLLPFNQFKELAKLNPTGFTRLNLALGQVQYPTLKRGLDMGSDEFVKLLSLPDDVTCQESLKCLFKITSSIDSKQSIITNKISSHYYLYVEMPIFCPQTFPKLKFPI